MPLYQHAFILGNNLPRSKSTLPMHPSYGDTLHRFLQGFLPIRSCSYPCPAGFFYSDWSEQRPALHPALFSKPLERTFPNLSFICIQLHMSLCLRSFPAVLWILNHVYVVRAQFSRDKPHFTPRSFAYLANSLWVFWCCCSLVQTACHSEVVVKAPMPVRLQTIACAKRFRTSSGQR